MFLARTTKPRWGLLLLFIPYPGFENPGLSTKRLWRWCWGIQQQLGRATWSSNSGEQLGRAVDLRSLFIKFLARTTKPRWGLLLLFIPYPGFENPGLSTKRLWRWRWGIRQQLGRGTWASGAGELPGRRWAARRLPEELGISDSDRIICFYSQNQPRISTGVDKRSLFIKFLARTKPRWGLLLLFFQYPGFKNPGLSTKRLWRWCWGIHQQLGEQASRAMPWNSQITMSSTS